MYTTEHTSRLHAVFKSSVLEPLISIEPSCQPVHRHSMHDIMITHYNQPEMEISSKRAADPSYSEVHVLQRPPVLLVQKYVSRPP